MSVPRTLLLVAVLLGAGHRDCRADHLDDIGYRALQQAVGAGLPTGAGVPIDQVEASTVAPPAEPVYRPNPVDTEFSGVTFIDQTGGSSPDFSGHATGVARYFAGTTLSISPGIAAVDNYEAGDWMAVVLYDDFGGLQRPVAGTGVAGNFSWIGSSNVAAENIDILQRVDWLVDETNYLHVVGTDPGSALLSHAFNVIAVGFTATTVVGTTAALDAIYTAGRANPVIVAPLPNRSLATGLVTSAAALLLDAAPGHTLPAAVVKAVLMAGASRTTSNTSGANLIDYALAPAHRTQNGLDRRYGAGQLNIHASYLMLAAGERNSTEDGGTAIGPRGYDHDPAFGGAAGANNLARYAFATAAVPVRLTVALVWQLDVNDDSGPFAPTRTLYNLDLELIDIGSGTTVASSTSTIDNSENLWLELPAQHSYELRVRNAHGALFNRPYALAWTMTNLQTPPAGDAARQIPATPFWMLILAGCLLWALARRHAR